MRRSPERPLRARSSVPLLAMTGALVVAATGCGKNTSVNPRDFDDPPACLVTGTNAPGAPGTSPIENCPDLTRPPGTGAPGSSTSPRAGGGSTVPGTRPPGSTSSTSRTSPTTSADAMTFPSSTGVPSPRVEEKAELARNRERWAGQHPTNYRYTWANGCFCPASATGPFVVTVHGDAVSIAPAKAGGPAPIAQLKPGIEDTFATAAQALEKAEDVTITYDPTYGYPTAVGIDWVKNAVDDEESVTINDLSLLP